MKILLVAQVEHDSYIREQLPRQTLKPDDVFIYVDEKPANTIEMRRKRIADNHNNHLKPYVENSDADLIWQIESDGQLPDNALEELYSWYLSLRGDDFGYISAIEVGRHGLYCLGAWRNFTDTSFESINHNLKGLQEIDATGFYCLLAPKDVWLSGKCEWNGEPYGPDVVWGRSINKKKYVDMDLHIGHKVKSGVILPSHKSTTTAHFYKLNDEWKYKVQ